MNEQIEDLISNIKENIISLRLQEKRALALAKRIERRNRLLQQEAK